MVWTCSIRSSLHCRRYPFWAITNGWEGAGTAGPIAKTFKTNKRMDFGKVAYNLLDTIDFTLPPEPLINKEVLPGKRVENPRVYVGCPRWSVKEWVGKLYPKGTKDSHFLDEYVRQFNCIELNSTFYNLYDEAAIAKWAAKAGESDFKFCPKLFQGISHEGHLEYKGPLTQAFEKMVSAFGRHLGPSFLQLSDGFGPQRKKELGHYLQHVTPSFFLFLELRHPGWFTGGETERLVQFLRKVQKGMVITDTAGRRDCCHMHLAGSCSLVRFVANNLHPTDYARINGWVERIAFWIENGLSELYFIIHMPEEKHSPEVAGYLVDRLNAACGLRLKKPVLLQQELF